MSVQINIHNLKDQMDNKLLTLKTKIEAHNETIKVYNARLRILDIPSLVIAGFAVLLSGINSVNPFNEITYTLLGITSLNMTLQSLKKYNDYEQKIASHAHYSKIYSQIVNTTEAKMLDIDGSPESLKLVYQDMLNKLSVIEDHQEFIPDYIMEKARKNFVVTKPLDIFRNSNMLQKKRLNPDLTMLTPQLVAPSTLPSNSQVVTPEEILNKKEEKECCDTEEQNRTTTSMSGGNIAKILNNVNNLLEKETEKAEIIDEAKELIKITTGHNVNHIRNPSRDLINKLSNVKDALSSVRHHRS
jgi:hypothetical protein